MISEEMKLIKFECIIYDIWGECFGEWLLNSEDIYNLYKSNLLKDLMGESNNNYSKIVLNNFFDLRYNFCEFKSNKNDLNILIPKCGKCATYNHDNKYIRCDMPRHLMFFSLLLIAVDNDLYNKKINIVSDLSYLLGFNLDMINDCIYLIRNMLEGDKVEFKQFNSNEAKKMFSKLKYK